MSDGQLDVLKQFITATVSQTELCLRDEISSTVSGSEARLRDEMLNGFAGIGEAIETLHERDDEVDQRLTHLEQKAA